MFIRQLAIAIALTLLYGAPLLAAASPPPSEILIDFPTCLNGDPQQPKSLGATFCAPKSQILKLTYDKVHDEPQILLGSTLYFIDARCDCGGVRPVFSVQLKEYQIDDIDKSAIALVYTSRKTWSVPRCLGEAEKNQPYIPVCSQYNSLDSWTRQTQLEAAQTCYSAYRKACADVIEDAKTKIKLYDPYTLTRTQTCHPVDEGVAVTADMTTTQSTTITVETQTTRGVTLEDSLNVTIGSSSVTTSTLGIEASVSVGAFGVGASIGTSVTESTSEENSQSISKTFGIQTTDSSSVGSSRSAVYTNTYEGGQGGARYVLWQVVDTFTLTRNNGEVVSEVRVNGPAQTIEYPYGTECKQQ